MKRVLNSQVVPIGDVPYEGDDRPRDHFRLDILVVDDEPVIADTLSTILSRSGYCARPAYDGKTALALARVLRPALVISDVVMPGMSGIELALALETLVPKCKVLLFSGQAATVDLLVRAREMGHDFAILNKPIHPADMLRRVSEIVQPAEQDSFAMVN
jgi:DNA-binding response OmpR family regulator